MATQLDQELIRRMLNAQANPVADFDPTQITQAVSGGINLADTIQSRKQGQEDRISALKEKIKAAKKEAEQAQRVQDFRVSGTPEAARSAYPDIAGKELLSTPAPKPSSFSKVGETTDEIILADLADPTREHRIKAPGIGGSGKEEAKYQAKIRQEAPKAKLSLDDAIREYNNMITLAESIKTDPALPFATGLPGVLGGRIPGIPPRRPTAQLETLKSKVLLNVLSALKQLSATGATGFGQLSNIEGENIRQSVATLDRGLQTGDFKQSLDSFQAEMKARKETLKRAYEDTYGEVAPDAPASNINLLSTGIPGETGGLDAAKAARLAELRAKRDAGTLR